MKKRDFHLANSARSRFLSGCPISLRPRSAVLASHSKLLKLDDFEVLSVHDLPFFQALTRAFLSPKISPIVFTSGPHAGAD
jgi:hypothetical protein